VGASLVGKKPRRHVGADPERFPTDTQTPRSVRFGAVSLLERLDRLDDQTTRRRGVRLLASITIGLLIGWNVVVAAANGDFVRALVMIPIGVAIVGAVVVATRPRTARRW